MLALMIKTHKAVVENEEKDIKALLVAQSTLLCTAVLFVLFGPPIVAVLPICISIIMLYPLHDYYSKWSTRTKMLLDAKSKVADHIDF